MPVLMSQGRAKQTQMSNTLLPRVLETAMSPWPSTETWDVNLNLFFVIIFLIVIKLFDYFLYVTNFVLYDLYLLAL